MHLSCDCPPDFRIATPPLRSMKGDPGIAFSTFTYCKHLVSVYAYVLAIPGPERNGYKKANMQKQFSRIGVSRIVI